MIAVRERERREEGEKDGWEKKTKIGKVGRTRKRERGKVGKMNTREGEEKQKERNIL